jgi:hypothetical protein
MRRLNHLAIRLIGTAVLSISARSASAELIKLNGPGVAAPGSVFFLLARLADNDDPLVAYSVEIEVVPQPGAVGQITGNAAISDFLLPVNVIDNGGGVLDPVLSFIIPTAQGGLFFNGVNASLLPVDLARTGINDVLGLAAFDVSADAFGHFTFRLGLASVLVDEAFGSIPFDAQTFTVFVPEPSSVVLLTAAIVAATLFGRRHPVNNKNR